MATPDTPTGGVASTLAVTNATTCPVGSTAGSLHRAPAAVRVEGLDDAVVIVVRQVAGPLEAEVCLD